MYVVGTYYQSFMAVNFILFTLPNTYLHVISEFNSLEVAVKTQEFDRKVFLRLIRMVVTHSMNGRCVEILKIYLT